MTEWAFELTDISFRYQSLPALDAISMRVRRGERVVLLGANGSGKSTLLRLLDALYFPQEGEMKAFDSIVSEETMADEAVNHAFRRRVGFVFQNPDVQIFNPTVLDEVAFGPLQLGWSKADILRQVEAILARFGINHLKDRPPHRLSGGEKKRVALASIMILEPEVLLLDEPTAALDPESQSEVIRFLIGSRNSGRTIITATHDLDIVEDIADHVFVLAKGKIAGAGKPKEILADEDLLRRTHLIHAHWHSHADGSIHTHRHAHGHRHTHGEEGSADDELISPDAQPHDPS